MANGLGGINFGGGGFYDFAAMNDMRLAQALQGKDLSALGSVGSSGTGQSEKLASLHADTKAFLKDYQSHMTGLMTAAKAVIDSEKKSTAAGSSDSKVADASVRYSSAAHAEYELDVKQLATKQTNSTAQFDEFAKSEQSGQLVIATNTGKDITIDMSSMGGKNNLEVLERAAKEINAHGAGVTAQVVRKDGKVSLEISSDKTGASGAFLASGSYSESSGLSAVKQEAQDAVYTVTTDGVEREFSSSENNIRLGDYKVEADLKGVGKATITVGQDADKTAALLGDLVSAYNDTLKFLNSNSGKGSGVSREIKNLMSISTSDKALEKIGISIGKSGYISFDKEKFLDELMANPDKTNKLISGSFGLAQNIYGDANKGLNISSKDLTSNTNPFASPSSGDSSGTYKPTGKSYSSATYRNVLNYSNTLALLNTLM